MSTKPDAGTGAKGLLGTLRDAANTVRETAPKTAYAAAAVPAVAAATPLGALGTGAAVGLGGVGAARLGDDVVEAAKNVPSFVRGDHLSDEAETEDRSLAGRAKRFVKRSFEPGVQQRRTGDAVARMVPNSVPGAAGVGTLAGAATMNPVVGVAVGASAVGMWESLKEADELGDELGVGTRRDDAPKPRDVGEGDETGESESESESESEERTKANEANGADAAVEEETDEQLVRDGIEPKLSDGADPTVTREGIDGDAPDEQDQGGAQMG